MSPPPEGAEETATAAPTVLFKKPRARPRGNIVKRPAKPQKDDSSSSGDDSSSDDNATAGAQHRAKRRRKGIDGGSSSAQSKQNFTELAPTVHQADRSVALKTSVDATKTSNWQDSDQKAKIGPTKSASNVRMTTFTEYTLGICKDYKKTGHCGFGDACIYVHDRGDWTQGWQLDNEWEKAIRDNKVSTKGTVVASANRNEKAEKNDEDDLAMLEKIPFACVICEKSYREPIVTRCGHYFCESCALGRYRKDPSCAACGAATNGVFNSASRLKKLLQRKREREDKKAAEAAGEDNAAGAAS